MELWVRSQAKEILTKAEHFDIYNGSIDDEEEVWCVEESGTDLGEYKSKKRALEILNEIQLVLLSDNQKVYQMPEE